MGKISFLLLSLILWAGETSAHPDPYWATISATALKANHKDKEAQYEEHAIYFPTTKEREAKKNPQKLKIRFWPSKKPDAPMVVLLAGLGGSHSTGYSNYYGYRLQKLGYQVLSLPSALHWQFALTASTSGYPGNSEEDARDLSLLIELSLNQLVDSLPSKLYLLGFSMGAFQGAYLSGLNHQRWEKIILVNPPVHLSKSTEKIQSMAAQPIPTARKKEIRELALLYGSKALIMDIGVHQESFDRIPHDLPLTLEERQYLIGDSLGAFLAPLVYATQENKDLGMLTQPFTQFFKGPRMEEAKKITIQEYFNWAKKVHSPEKLERNLSLFHSLSHERKNVYVLHNQDDFLLDAEDLSLLKEKYGENLTLFPWGGHMGNLWTNEHFQKIQNLLQ